MKAYRILLILFSIAILWTVLMPSQYFIKAAKSPSGSEPSTDTPVIGICLDANNEYTSYVVRGFKDAINDANEGVHILYAEQNASEAASPSTAVETLIQAQSQVLFTFGGESLGAAAELTDSIPIVFGDVIDYRNRLHLLPDTGTITGRNVTGVSGVPPIDRQLSLLIEAAGHTPHAVGILYDPADTEAILQNEIMEHYLNEAKIPWREYELTDAVPGLSDADITIDGTDTGAVPFPSITAAASGKEGANIHPDSIGESGDLTGINEPMSARTAQISALWKHASDLTEMTWEETIRTACEECDALYLCSRNRIAANAGQLAQIRDIAAEYATITVGGDAAIGADTLVCLYEDPYALGYQCGGIAARLLDDEDAVQDIPVAPCDPQQAVKLYNETLSRTYGMTWPKSFYERTSYLRDYASKDFTDAAFRISKNPQ